MMGDLGHGTLVWDDGRSRDLEHLELLGEGDDFQCYVLDGRDVLRLAKHARASASLRREMRLLPQLQKFVDARIPNIEGSGIRTDSGDRFISYPLLFGTRLAPQVLAGLETGCRLELIRQVARFASQLHGVPIELARSSGVTDLVARDYIAGLLGAAKTAIRHAMNAGVWQYHQRLAERYLDTPQLQMYRPSFLHGDLSPDHLLTDTRTCELTGVIDFSDCCVGDPLRDFIYIHQYYGDATLAEVLEIYRPEENRAEERIRIYQEMNSVQYCLSMHAKGDEEALTEGIQILAKQASGERVDG